jgi:hypothetical protein
MFYKKLDIDNFKKVQEKIVPYITDFVIRDVESSEEKFSEKVSFNFISNEDLIKFKEDIPELFECIRRELGSEVPYMAFVYIDEVRSIELHTDGDNSIQRRIRLHWPILNSTSAETVYYKSKHDNINSTHHSFKSGVSGHQYDPDDVYEVDRYVLDVPTLNSVKEIHGVDVISDKLPRILLTMRLSNEDEVYQNHFKLS